MSNKLMKQGYGQFENRMSQSAVVPHEGGDINNPAERVRLGQVATDVKAGDADPCSVSLARMGEGGTLGICILGREGGDANGDCIYAGAESRFFVRGNMDASESGAVTQLLQWLDAVTDRFFSEEIQNSFKKAVSLGFDGRQLAYYSHDVLCPENAPLPAMADQGGIGSIPLQGRVCAYAYEIDAEVRLGDAIKYTRVLNEIFDFWHSNGLFEKPGQFVTDVAQRLIMKKSVIRDADSRLTDFFSDMLASLGVMPRH